ncbi:MAG: c-type cytochrome [Solirubrobacterales bacterium]|nr:c-type cytochrome [Solirubrobacterales bacterium]
MRRLLVVIPIAAAALVLAACGTEDVSVTNASDEEGAVLFADHCAGCHTLSAAGTQGSGNRSLRAQGPNLDQREISYDDALYAIHNGGASGAVMPQNIVVGDDAEKVAQFINDYSGTQVEDSPRPSADGSGSGSG